MGFVLKCSECRAAIRFKGKWPSSCPHCGVVMETGDDDVIACPAFLTKAKHVDQVYRDIEKGSEIRAQVAAEMLGVPASDVSDIKITNLREAKHEGEIAAMPVNNAVSQQMEILKQRGAAVGFVPNGASYGAQVQTGPSPNAGAHQLTRLQAVHGKISEMPALETLQPGYIRRA